ncbi:TDP-N-acetylfucosamine:lipid II N-acetylfucosaminyltransferase [Flavobacterium sp. AS60]|uniref:TDP-N-acetylfucosamine:lipid II N-acetylfucosaminyltransferase n=1 Tax=Flavobacterium anseongense TaxID=2910677 RepID=UPI001F16B1AB|nr:TDP-N-acetylfucosamine:lipid II N-acetylfucosaminyltransferase [Flavobacterium sp. AS60]MCF6130038.1 TDP-N-acetylfucosamine:lipid II N-acetylfucosaminyltransferase [Flavobacterium sp. AS60]
MILHLVHDEKIINRTIAIFEEAAPKDNLFVVFTRHKLKHVHNQENVILFKDFEKKYGNTEFSSVIIHFLNSRKIRFVNKNINKKTPIYWIIWGNDLYNKLLYPKGFELYDKQSSYHKNTKSFIRNFFDKLIGKFKIIKIENFISNRINYVVTDATKNDYEMLLKYYPRLKNIQWKEFFYYPIESILGSDLMQKKVKGNNIQIGNSASVTNNHEYAMRFLSKLNLDNRNIYVPLSYSGTKEYKESVKRKGLEYFGDNFKALDDFLPLEDYNQLMLSFDIAIYGNFRQEALGNILISLYLGAKVFLAESNPVYLWAEKLNLRLFKLESISQTDIDQPLDIQSQTHNRNIILEIYNTQRLKSLIKENFINNSKETN